jgi:SAM-dependent methyltransferase
MDQQFWDNRYLEQTKLWSGQPNGLLVAEAAGLAPGRALDVGCGEGADAVWLAERGWTVTGVDISRVALDRAAEVAASAGLADRLRWTHADLSATPPRAGAFDLVSALYFPILKEPNHDTLRGLLDAVAPGGTLLIGGHDLTGREHDHASGFNPADYYRHDELVPLLDDTWTIVTDEIRPRVSPAPPGSGHIKDTVLVARR